MTRAVTFGRAPAGETHIHGFDAFSVITAACIGALALCLAALAVDALRDRDWTLMALSSIGAVIAAVAAVAIARTTLPWEAR